MFCGHCGIENSDEYNYCKNCGKELKRLNYFEDKQGSSIKICDDKVNDWSQTDIVAEKRTTNKKNRRIQFTFILVFIGIIVLGIVWWVSSRDRKISMSDFIRYQIDGYEGYGEADIYIDWEDFQKEYGDQIRMKEDINMNPYISALANLVNPIEYLKYSVDIVLEKDKMLSNGDKIPYKWKVNERYIELFDCEFDFTDGEIKIAGLSDVSKVNPFDYLNVSFEGASPYGEVRFQYNGNNFTSSDFCCDKDRYLRNGDTLIVTVKENIINDFAVKYGVELIETRREYEVTGLAEYLNGFSELPPTSFVALCNDAKTTILDYAEQNHISSSKLRELNYNGYVMNCINSAAVDDEYNNLYIIFSGTLYSEDNLFSEAKVFFPIHYYNLVIQEDGELSYDKEYEISGHSLLDSLGWYYTDGYTDPLKCYEILTDDKRYTYEIGGDFEKFSGRIEDIIGNADIEFNEHNIVAIYDAFLTGALRTAEGHSIWDICYGGKAMDHWLIKCDAAEYPALLIELPEASYTQLLLYFYDNQLHEKIQLGHHAIGFSMIHNNNFYVWEGDYECGCSVTQLAGLNEIYDWSDCMLFYLEDELCECPQNHVDMYKMEAYEYDLDKMEEYYLSVHELQ